MGQDGGAAIGGAVLVEAQRRRRLKEAVVQEADMERTRQMAEHGAHPAQVNDAAGEVVKLVPHALELAQNTHRCRAGRLEAPPEVFVMLDDVVKAAERAFLLDFAAKTRCRSAGIAFKHRDRSVLVLYLSGHGSKGTVCDVPRHGAPELSGGKVPALTVWTVGYRWRTRSPIGGVEVRAECVY